MLKKLGSLDNVTAMCCRAKEKRKTRFELTNYSHTSCTKEIKIKVVLFLWLTTSKIQTKDNIITFLGHRKGRLQFLLRL